MGSIYMCPCCYKIYDSNWLKIENGCCRCPDLECNSADMSLFEIDELMIEPIRILNQKGYITEYCCSGHVFNKSSRAYIKFYSECTPDTVPNGWVKNKDIIETSNRETLFNNEIYKSLIDWCKSLEELNF